MASQKKIIQMIASVKTIYPYYAKNTDVQLLVRTWGLLLKDYPDNAVDVAFYKCLQTCKMPPTPADIIETLKALQETAEPTDEELWNKLTVALKEADRLIYKFPYTFVEANGRTQGENARQKFKELWESLPENVKQYLGGRSEFMRMAQDSDSDSLKFERTRFLKTMPIIKSRAEFGELQLLLQSNGFMFERLEGGKDE